MQQKLWNLTQALYRLLASRKFFWAVLGFLVVESVWIAISARYPMAFDEEFHFGVIKLYAANNFSPFFAAQPENADVFGAIARDPSYLYHYLMSFPYRLISLVADSQMAQVIALRLINVALVAGGFVAFRALLLRAKLSKALTHVVLAVFALVPIVPQLAGQINYDNLLLLTVPLTLLLTLKVADGLRARTFPAGQMLLLIAALMLECLVKYPFLPIALAIAAYVGYWLVRAFWGHGRELARAVRAGFGALPRKKLLGLGILLVMSAGLFFQRYGLNMITYHTPLPDCAAVLSVEECKANGPWARNHLYKQQKTEVDGNVLKYTDLWLHAMLLRSVFAINGPFSDYVNHFPLWLPQATLEILAVASVVLVLLFAVKLFANRPEFQLFLLAAGMYIAVLFWNNYRGYLRTGEPVAINGRYLLLVLPLVLAIAGTAWTLCLQKLRLQKLKSWFAVAIILLLLQGGGFITWILQSDESWYWQNCRPVAALNSAARTVLRPLVYEKQAERFLKYE